MTNKTKTILCVCALTASAFAWNATAEGETTGTSYWPAGYDSAWYLYNPNPDSGMKLTVFQAVANNATLSFEIERNDTKNGFIFGTYTVDGDGNIIRDTLGTVTSSTVGENGKIQFKDASGETQNSVNSGTFESTDVVGVWVQELKANAPFYYSENQLSLDNNGTIPTYQYTEGYIEGGYDNGAASLYFDNGEVGSTPTHYGEGYPGQGKAAIKIHVQGVAPASDGNVSGGPLPGVWATIALAGAASAYLKRRRKENK